MPPEAGFSCLIVGEGSMPIRCGALLLERGHEIRGVLSPDPVVRQWAVEHGIPTAGFDEDILAFARRAPFDYLFSIVNPRLLPREVLDLPRRLAINYHDAPLPRYAGVHATFWALLNREPRHAISWHVMEVEADAGDIVKQVPIEVAPDETSVTLNARCYSAAIGAFAEMIDELAEGRAELRKQDLAQRTYVGLHDRPPAAGLVSWHQDALALDALGRASEFGAYRNRVGLPRLIVQPEPVVVGRLRGRAGESGAAPGTIVALAEAIEVAAPGGVVSLSALRTLDGAPLPVAELARRAGLRVGTRLPQLEAADAERVTAYDVEARRHEAYWVRRLASLEPLSLAPMPTADGRRATREAARLETSFDELAGLADMDDDGALAGIVAALACALRLLHAAPAFDIGLSPPGPMLGELDALYAGEVPLRVALDHHVSVGHAFGAVRDEVAGLRRRRSYLRDVVLRYPELAGWLQQGGLPRLPVAVLEVDSLAGHERPLGTQLALAISRRERRCLWSYDPALLDAAMVGGLRDAVVAVWEASRATPGRRFGAVPLVAQAARERLLELGLATRPHPEPRTLVELFAEQVRRAPAALAVAFGDRRLTYAELDAAAERIAGALRRRGIGPESRVGVHMERSLEMVVALLGIVKAGGAYVPLDPSYPPHRLAFMVRDSEMRLVIAEAARVEQLRALATAGGEPITVATDEELVAEAPAGGDAAPRATRDVAARNLAYVMYTSGSTGTPKGVAVEHRNIVRLVRDTNYIALGPTDRIAQASNMSFDAATLEIWGALLNGGALVGIAREVTLSPAALAAALRSEGITVLWLTVALFNQIARERPDAFATLRYLLTGGDALDPVTTRMVLEGGAPAHLCNGYGPTENTTFSAVHLIERVPDGATTVPIGRPIAHSSALVLSPGLELVPAGVAGELYVGGAGVSRGYLNRPALTAERFVPDPFTTEPGGRLYRTGDLVRWNARGELEFLGRIDQQVKIRGFRIELGEIEAALASHPDVRECVVTARELAAGKQLVAYVVGRDGKPAPDGATLREFLGRTLPEYMVPAAFVPLPQLPVTPNGKIDRRALPAPSDADLARDAEPERAADLVELQLTDLWEHLLGRRGIGVMDDFFALGGHSLLAVSMFTEIERIFGRNLPLVTLFEAPTIRQLAARLRALDSRGDWPTLVPLRAGGDRPPLFLIPGGGGNLLAYRHLLAHLPPDQPCFGLQPPGLAGSVAHFETIEDLATHYRAEVERVQPHGPYYLKGWCIGGLVALELAQQLRRQGEDVRFLAMVDTPYPLTRVPSLRERLGFHVRRVARLRLAEAVRYVAREALAMASRRLRHRETEARNAALMATQRTAAAAERQEVEEHIRVMDLILSRRYRPRPYPGHLTLIWPTQKPPESYVDSPVDWPRLAGGDAEHHVLPGEHDSMYEEPHVRELAGTLSQLLERAQSGVPSSPPTVAEDRDPAPAGV